MSNLCHLMIDSPAEGAWNMAVDEALLGIVAKSGIPTLRLYQWIRPTLSLGYFQSYSEREKHPASLQADIVRRLSGGGAILHDKELTYSLVLPATHSLARDTQELYQAVHKAFITSLKKILSSSSNADNPSLCESASGLDKSQEPFLCFQRRTSGDVLLGEAETSSAVEIHKVLGSAQRRTQGSVLQHGSLLLNRSPLASELPGISDLAGKPLEAPQVIDHLLPELEISLGLRFQNTLFSEANRQLAQQIVQQRYSNSDWLERR